MEYKFHLSTLVMLLIVGDGGEDPAEYMRFFYVDEGYLSDESDPDEGQLMRLLLEKVDGLHYDDATRRQRERLDLLFEWMETGRQQGWVVEQSWARRTAPPNGGRVTRVVSITSSP